jgi:hypothetical protein
MLSYHRVISVVDSAVKVQKMSFVKTTPADNTYYKYKEIPTGESFFTQLN